MSWTHLEDTWPNARKRYRCYLCGKPIEIGQTYLRRKGTDCGMFVTARMHEECEKQTHDWDATDWETFMPGELPDRMEVE